MIESPPGLFLHLKLEDIYHNIPAPHFLYANNRYAA